MADTTTRYALPLIAAGQAQKELFHNEALARLDVALHPAVQAIGTNEPPAAPQLGQCWIVGTAPIGAWSGHAGTLAGWTDGGWRFVTATIGMSVWLIGDNLAARYDGVAWRIGESTAARLVIGGLQVVGPRQPGIAEPAGGGTVDAVARAALTRIIATLQTHGLID